MTLLRAKRLGALLAQFSRVRGCKRLTLARSAVKINATQSPPYPGASNLDNLIANHYDAALHQIQLLVK